MTVPQGRYVGGGAAKQGEVVVPMTADGEAGADGLAVETARDAEPGGALVTGGFAVQALATTQTNVPAKHRSRPSGNKDMASMLPLVATAGDVTAAARR